MSHKINREFKTSPNCDNERADDGNEQQLQISRIEETDQQTIVPSFITEDWQNQVAVGSLASTSASINVSLNVGKLQF